MKTITASILLANSLLVSSFASAEISSLTPEELTDTYIKDTTVIVRQKEQETPMQTIPVSLKVTPLEKAAQVLPEDQTHSVSSISNELRTYDDLNNLSNLDRNTQPQLPEASTEFLKSQPSLSVLKQIQDAYGLDKLPTDLTTLGFNQNMANDIAIQGNLPSNTGFAADDKSMTFTIPNLGNFNTQQIQSPNGEISVNVNPNQIQYIINLPK